MESAILLAADHPAYPGHFPGHPILPGVVLVAEAIAAIARDTGREASAWTLGHAKFLSPVTPGTRLQLVRTAGEDGVVRFEVRAGERIVASGALVPRG